MDDYTRAVYTRPLRLKSEAVKASKASRAAAENQPGKRAREIMMGNTHEVLMGKMRDSIMLHTTVPYHSAPNGVAERMIGVLTIAVHTGRGWVQVGYISGSAHQSTRAIAKGNVQTWMETHTRHQNKFVASVSANGPKISWCRGLGLVVSGKWSVDTYLSY